MPMQQSLFHIDALSLIMMSLTGCVALCVTSFSARYLKGDRCQRTFYIKLLAMTIAVFSLVNADQLLVMLLSWAASNFFLVQLMQHKKQWNAAKQSSILAFKNFTLGLSLLSCAFFILYKVTGQTSIQAIIQASVITPWISVSSMLILTAAMTQSALWPFHRWLISSLNSPTPVSAIMHAGLVNGGGFLLARFSPLLIHQPMLLNTLFIAGISTALIGTLWKLMQSDIKRMLACSTMGQMGFMMAQCGLGLFPAAVAHLCWHGLFKAYLFLSASSAAQERRLDLDHPPSLRDCFKAFFCGLAGAYLFALTSHRSLQAPDTHLFLVAVVAITGTQFALPILRKASYGKLILAFAFTIITGALYGSSLYLFENALTPLNMSQPQPLNLIHITAFGLCLGAWLILLLAKNPRKIASPDYLLKHYVKALNSSQPAPKTVTAHRNNYYV